MLFRTQSSDNRNKASQIGIKTPVVELYQRFNSVYQSPVQERIHYLEGKLVELLREIKGIKTDNKRLRADLEEREIQLSKCRSDLILSYETSMQTRGDMLELLEKLQECDLMKDAQEAETMKD
ncbi:uncharacterized protein PHALS_10617 [Plasmopara halstedii]|uniref:Uncharacterized protein n=1 Tax=Plasmopara halstedii TaxID=4781 RepID=A0A0P1AHF7_PLAHL|nr:uncharacterized protein PHALS_10617 [Plasmopara halstedii]CEG40416.1 hypothetical protein PHALS_10617 [Plasmopara halstedii]|eukprot:XP_024576785.1 hypothetical protein PHALS_10617 [Plasmopara halstedii]